MYVYLAGPLGFTESGRAFHSQTIIPKIESLGFQILDPWAMTDEALIKSVQSMPLGTERKLAWQELNYVMGENNHRAIDRADIVFAILDGVDVDSGTSAEIGYAFAAGKPIVGYRSDLRQTGENEGALVNLQVEYFINKSGGKIIQDLEALDEIFNRM